MKILILSILMISAQALANEFKIKHSSEGENHIITITPESKEDLSGLEFHLGYLASAKTCLNSKKKYTYVKEFGGSNLEHQWKFECHQQKGDELRDQSQELRHSCLTEDANDDIREFCEEIIPKLKMLVPN
jgi:hypothetical protein